MNNNSQISDDLLVKYLLQEASPEERLHVEQWLSADEANEKQFQHFLLIWDESKKLEKVSTVDTDAVWQRFKQRTTEKPTGRTIEMPVRKNNWMRVAATLVVLLGASWMAYYMYNGRDITLQANGAIIAQTLPDGTTVTLNKNASITYPRTFNGEAREVKLEGEAFFNVTPDKIHPFIIHANEADIRVVGTSFNVKSNAEVTEVIVETGIVEVRKKTKMVQLKPKQKSVVKKNVEAPSKEASEDELYNYYRTKEFVCNGTPLYRLIEVLNEAYDAHIIINNEKIKDLPLTTTFHNESLDDILEVISGTFNITIEKKGDQIILN
ncbi:MAG: FecR domain-containing protein [Bacteroidetes bacterium]|nr:FecR domain-containing protein [Bacteroidota bacterium]